MAGHPAGIYHRILAPTLSGLMLCAMLVDVYRYERPGIRIAYRTDVQLLNRRWMHCQSRISTSTVHELLFADDCTLNATSEGDMQRSMNLVAAACDSCGLITDTEKTVVMHQPPLDDYYVAHQINGNGAQLQIVDDITYLGSTVSRNTRIDDKVARRIPKASQSSSSLKHSLEPTRSPP
ncbi:hypothetical protein SprV_0200813000 [Sparganum proliferum]